jgi:RNA recognition motif-containing protein
MFSRFGRVIQVSAKKNVIMRGQAFIVFQSPAHAQEALKNLNKAPFFGKYMEVQWAKRDSDITLSPQKIENVRKTRRRVISKTYFQSAKFKERMTKKLAQRSKEIQALDQVNMNLLDKMLNPNVPLSNTDQIPTQTIPQNIPQKKLNEPHSMLILEKLPRIPTEELKLLFSGLEGYKEIRHIESKGIALVDFEDANVARTALETVESHIFEGGERIHINFAKK